MERIFKSLSALAILVLLAAVCLIAGAAQAVPAPKGGEPVATIAQMVTNRLPDEAELFSGSLSTFVEENKALAGYEAVAEGDMSTLQKALVADMAAKAMILPAMSRYKKDLAKAEGDGAGTAEFVDKLKFLTKMDAKLDADIAYKQAKLGVATDTGVPLVVVESS